MQSPDNILRIENGSENAIKFIEITDDLSLLRKELCDVEDQIYDLNLSFAEEQAKIQEVIKNFLDKLIENKDKFKLVFKTNSSSLYFVSNAGHCWRFKATSGSYKTQPVLKKVFFVSQIQANDLLELLKSGFLQEEIINLKIDKIDFGTNAVPVEFGVEHSPEIVFKEDADSLTILGTKYENRKEIDPSFASGIHIGHPISEIIKS